MIFYVGFFIMEKRECDFDRSGGLVWAFDNGRKMEDCWRESESGDGGLS